MDSNTNYENEAAYAPQTLTLPEVAECIRGMDPAGKTVILCHAHPDGDAVGSAEGLRLILKALHMEAVCVCADPVPAYLQSIPEVPFLHCPEPNALPEFDNLFCVDTAQAYLLGSLSDWAPDVDLKLDHHMTGDDFAAFNFVDSTASAAGEIIFALAELLGVMNPQIAAALYAAIASDTGCFRYSNTTAATLRICATLFEQGIDASAINTALFESKELSLVKATALGINRMRLVHGGQVALLLFTEAMKQEGGFTDDDLTDIVASLREISGVELAVLIRQSSKRSGEFRISTRSKSRFDCTTLCGVFGGGGHLRAAGATVFAPSPADALRQVSEQIDKLFDK